MSLESLTTTIHLLQLRVTQRERQESSPLGVSSVHEWSVQPRHVYVGEHRGLIMILVLSRLAKRRGGRCDFRERNCKRRILSAIHLVALRSIHLAASTFGFHPEQRTREWNDARTATHANSLKKLKTDRSVDVVGRSVSWQIIAFTSGPPGLRKHHESPRRASLITVRNCKSISRGCPFALAQTRVESCIRLRYSGDLSLALLRTKASHSLSIRRQTSRDQTRLDGIIIRSRMKRGSIYCGQQAGGPWILREIEYTFCGEDDSWLAAVAVSASWCVSMVACGAA